MRFLLFLPVQAVKQWVSALSAINLRTVKLWVSALSAINLRTVFVGGTGLRDEDSSPRYCRNSRNDSSPRYGINPRYEPRRG